ncbi:DUF5131 family protein [Sinorhizobium meliloti]|uniref:DUF5131 family protein n=1 Tax=Rhizobium meliloti TaxID=382 RepID=UPI000B499ABB|nr:phage Gp37/Gp68 family protein [Sinorhizobium meliloti]ASQ11079.1 phage Gp37/Gp68 family protein [Sinorhizobium meliloti]MQU85748.1 DUF5131 family protein [Sinorhizobium meliloti]MQU89284.1 DUF5131 family protein [Sinorhizobium meliloti]
MGANTKISWADHTFNPWIGCQKVSPGCDHCYAEGWAERFGTVTWGPHGARRRTSAATWRSPSAWPRIIDGRRPRIFCASLADVFDNRVPREWRADLFALIQAMPWFDWLILTKRPENVAAMLPDDWNDGWANVWLGISAEDQAHYDRRWPILADIPAAVRFVSYEPALGPLSISGHPDVPDWLIAGCESGKGARPANSDWFRSIRDECTATDTAFFLKQTMHDGRKVETPELDGKHWTEFPIPAIRATAAPLSVSNIPPSVPSIH